MNLHRLQVFVAVARNLSFSQTAEDLNTSQPNISRHIAKLEAELEVSLFHRLGGRVALTDAGYIVNDNARRIFESVKIMHRALDELRGLEHGFLRLAASSTPGHYRLPHVISVFQSKHPGLEIEFYLGSAEKILKQVLDNEVDLGIVEGPVAIPRLHVQPYLQDKVLPVAHPRHRLAAASDLTPEFLAEETLILAERGSGRRQLVDEAFLRWDVQPKKVLVIQSCEGIKRAVAAGLGISFISHYAIDMELHQEMLTVLAGEALILPQTISLVSHKGVRQSAAMLAFLAHLHKPV